MDGWILIAVGIFAVIVFIGGLAVIITKFYRKVDQGQALIINTMKDEPIVTFTGGTVLPIIHRAEVMDISVKRIDIDRRGNNGLICKDCLRADINVNFFIRINPETSNVLEVASMIGCRRASDLKSLDELFNAKFSEALKTAGKQFEFKELFEKRDGFRDKVKEVIGQDLNGFVLEDVAIDYLEQTDLKHLNPDDVNDAVGIEKITEVTQGKRVREAELSNEAEAAIAAENVKKWERIKQAERQEAEIEEQTTQAKEEARIRREKEVSSKELTKNKEIELQRKQDEAAMLSAEQDKLRQAEIALKDRERAIILKEEENLRIKLEEQKKREEREIVLEIQKRKKAEDETAMLKEAEGRKIEQEERNKTIQEEEGAKRLQIATVINAEAEAKEKRIKEEEAAQARKKVTQIEAELAKFDLQKTEIQADAQKMKAEANAFEKERLADAQAREFAATEMAKVQVERDREDLRKIRIGNDDLELNIMDRRGIVESENQKRSGQATASNIRDQGQAKAANIRDEGQAKAANIRDEGEAKAVTIREQGLAKAEVDDRNVGVQERSNTIEAVRIRQVGEAEAESHRLIKLAEAEGMSKLADAQKLLDSISQEREEFRLRLEKDTEVQLAQIEVRKDIAEAQATVLAEAFKATDVRIIGGDGQFFDRFIHAASMGQALDAAVGNSNTIQSLSKDYLSGKGNIVEDVTKVLTSPSMGASNLRDVSLTALLGQLVAGADGDQKKKLEELLAHAAKLNLEK